MLFMVGSNRHSPLLLAFALKLCRLLRGVHWTSLLIDFIRLHNGFQPVIEFVFNELNENSRRVHET